MVIKQEYLKKHIDENNVFTTFLHIITIIVFHFGIPLDEGW